MGIPARRNAVEEGSRTRISNLRLMVEPWVVYEGKLLQEVFDRIQTTGQ